ncbi:MAG: glycosyltransferase [Sneathiella sp.]|nr:glycosyltransferase [Sneathiella sp.]
MPLYNAEKHIRQALDCLLRQTRTDFEIIISDNQSTDNTLEIVQEYAAGDERIKIFRQPENIGPIPNFQFVLKQASGQYFMWRSYDDWSDDDYLEKLASLLDSNNAIDLAVAKVVLVSSEREKIVGAEISKAGKSGRIIRSIRHLKISHPGWMYGLFRREVALQATSNVVRNFPHVWGWDHLILFPSVSQNRVGGAYDTRFFQRETGISNDRYRPRRAKDQIKLAYDFYGICYNSYMNSEATALDKITMALYLLRYTSSKTEKFTRILRIALGLREL